MSKLFSMRKEMLFIKLYFAMMRKQWVSCVSTDPVLASPWHDDLAVVWIYFHLSVTVLRPVMLAQLKTWCSYVIARSRRPDQLKAQTSTPIHGAVLSFREALLMVIALGRRSEFFPAHNFALTLFTILIPWSTSLGSSLNQVAVWPRGEVGHVSGVTAWPRATVILLGTARREIQGVQFEHSD
jgi:hypothetical protein